MVHSPRFERTHLVGICLELFDPGLLLLAIGGHDVDLRLEFTDLLGQLGLLLLEQLHLASLGEFLR